MDDQLVAMLRYAAAVPRPLRLRLRQADGTVTEQSFESPFVTIGRGEGCDVRIPESNVSFRHAYLQAIGSHVACVDLMSVAGLRWSGPPFHGWVSPAHALQIGSCQIELMDDGWELDETLKPPLDFRPRDEQRNEYGMLPIVDLELLNTTNKGKKWPINRVITLIGRDDRCRITVMDDRLSRVQCALLLLPSGLWVIDLLGKGGIQINGQSCKCSLVAAGSELSLGAYKVTAHYPQTTANLELAAQIQGSGIDFLTRPNRIFQAEFYHDTLIVVPLGDSQSFFYQDIHIEASRILELISQRGFKHVVVDFGRVEQTGFLILETLMSICRAAPGRSALCGANSQTFATVQSSPLNRLFDHYNTRAEALQAVYLPA